MLKSWIVTGMLLVSSLIAAACASAGGPRLANCDAEPGDSVFAAGGPVYHDCAVDRKATLSNRPTIDFRPATVGNACFSADLQFVVGANGRPETATARVIRSTNQAFADAVLQSLGSWRYDPAVRNGEPVREIVTEHRTAAVAVVIVKQGDVPRPPDRAPQC